MNRSPFFRCRIRTLYFFLIQSKSTNIENRVQIRPILYCSQPIRLQISYICSFSLILFVFSHILHIFSLIFVVLSITNHAEGHRAASNIMYIIHSTLNMFTKNKCELNTYRALGAQGSQKGLLKKIIIIDNNNNNNNNNLCIAFCIT